MHIVDELIESWGGDLGDNSVLLDFGCGTGEFSLYEEKRFGKIILYDICEQVLNDVVIHKECNKFSSLKSLMDYPCDFDLILCITVLEHIMGDEELDAVMRWMHKRLKTEGIIVLIMMLSHTSHPEYMRNWNLRDVECLFTEKGFSVVGSNDLYKNGLANDGDFIRYRKNLDVRLLGKMYPSMPGGIKKAIRKYLLARADKYHDLSVRTRTKYLYHITENQGHKVFILKNEADPNTEKV